MGSIGSVPDSNNRPDEITSDRSRANLEERLKPKDYVFIQRDP
jgi:hypothetical protein